MHIMEESKIKVSVQIENKITIMDTLAILLKKDQSKTKL